MAKIILGLIVVGLVALFLIRDDEQPGIPNTEDIVNEAEDPVIPVTGFETYSDASLDFSFRYPSTYIKQEPQLASGAAHRLKTIMLVHENDRAMLENPPVGGEGPAAITVAVFHNATDEGARAWANSHPQESNINLVMGGIEDVSVGGAEAVRYRADGLYASEVAVITHGSYVYVVHGAFVDESSPTLRDYEPLLASMTFESEE